MKSRCFSRVFTIFLSLILLVSTFSFDVSAVQVDESRLKIYQVTSEQNWQLAPGIIESEIILNNLTGDKRQVTHVVEIDVTNPYTKILPSYKGMAEGLNAKEYGTQIMSEQAKYAEENGYGNVVAAMNTCLHWYDTDYYAKHPELIGEPLGTLILDGVRYTNSQNSYFGAYTCIVINFDNKDGQPRPDNIPKVEVRQTYDSITGWEEQLIPASFHFLVKDGVNQHSINDPEPQAPRSMMGIKADGTLILVMVDGRQAPYSTGFNAYEMAEYMISLGCVHAINCDGGGSSTFLSQRPGEDLELHCFPSDGKERAVTQGILVISTAHICEWEYEGIVTPATCTKDGEKNYTCKCGKIMSGVIEAPGHIDEDGDLCCDLCSGNLGAKNGIVFEKNGDIRYYVNGVATRAGLVHDSNGNYYYINSTLKAVKNCPYAFSNAMGNGLLPGGTYQFGADGKMINPPTENSPHIHEWGEWADSTTCTEGGIKTYVCECGLSKSEATLPLEHIDETNDYKCDRCGKALTHTHIWGTWVVTTPATEEAAGVETRTCANCGETETRETPKLDHVHVWGDWVVTTPATYDNAGVETRKCGVCGTTETREIPKLVCSHIWSVWEVTTPATYDNAGVETRKCGVCGTTETREIPKLDPPPVCDHTWGDWLIMTEATTTAAGEEARACTLCGIVEEREIAKIDPSTPKNGVVFDPDGNIRYYVDGVATRAYLVKYNGHYYYFNSTLKAVKNCKYSFSNANGKGMLPGGTYQFDAEGRIVGLPVTECQAHFWGEWVVKTPATDTTVGSQRRECYYCSTTDTEEIPVTGVCTHNWGAWIVATPATEYNAGVEARSCAKCGEIETRELPKLDHVHVWGDWVVTTPASYTAKGVETKTCGVCGGTENRELPMLVCTSHAWSAWVVTTPATYENTGIETRTCANCGATETQVIDKLVCTHSWGAWVVTKPATTSATGVETRTCANCGATETQTIAKLPSDPNVKQGLVWDDDGNIRYYENGVAVCSKGLVEYEGNYYYINSTSKAVKNCTYTFSTAKGNGLLPGGTYQFDAEGRLILK